MPAGDYKIKTSNSPINYKEPSNSKTNRNELTNFETHRSKSSNSPTNYDELSNSSNNHNELSNSSTNYNGLSDFSTNYNKHLNLHNLMNPFINGKSSSSIAKSPPERNNLEDLTLRENKRDLLAHNWESGESENLALSSNKRELLVHYKESGESEAEINNDQEFSQTAVKSHKKKLTSTQRYLQEKEYDNLEDLLVRDAISDQSETVTKSKSRESLHLAKTRTLTMPTSRRYLEEINLDENLLNLIISDIKINSFEISSNPINLDRAFNKHELRRPSIPLQNSLKDNKSQNSLAHNFKDNSNEAVF